MKEDEYREILRRIEFNRTEPEVLVRLIDSASKKGEKAQIDFRSLRKAAEEFSIHLSKTSFIHTEAEIPSPPTERVTCVGIDGSMFPIGGVGGLWYVPYAIVRIIFPEGDKARPAVDVFAAGVEAVSEHEDYNIKGHAERFMMIGETKAIRTWGEKGTRSIVFIDGPAIDPPALVDEVYVRERAAALRSVVAHSTLLGCVKRSRDSWLLEALRNERAGDFKKEALDLFPSDQHFLSFVFTALRKAGTKGCLYTSGIEVSSRASPVLSAYSEEGMRLVSFFFERDAGTVPLRFDIPVFKSEPLSSQALGEIVSVAATHVLDWTYPKYDYPLPVMLAHEKCMVKEGCAEVLYDEIITRTHSGDPYDQLAALQLR